MNLKEIRTSGNDLSFVFGTGDKPYLKIKEDVYTTIGYLVFRGTDIVGIPTNIKVMASLKEVATTDVDVRIYDSTNANVICEVTGITDLIPTLYDLGTLSNLPTVEAVFEIRAKVGTDGKEGWIHTMGVQF